VFRARTLEAALGKDFRPEALDGLSIDPSRMLSDANATPEYRGAHLVMVMARRALQNLGRAMSYK
jgi:carbon-monoxide dehydrogenase medium subunit